MSELPTNDLRTKVEIITIIFLLICCSIFYYQRTKANQKYDDLVSSQKTGATAGKINEPKKEVDEREKNLYPEINEKICNINTNIKSLNETVKRLELQKVTREKINENFKTKNAQDLSNFFNANGIPNSIISK